MAKKLDRNTIVGRQGVNLVERVILSMGYAWNETRMDAGIDGTIEIRDPHTGQMSNSVVLAQIKSGDSYFKAENSVEFAFHPDPEDLRYWLDGNVPVVLFVCRPDKDETYWVSLRDYFRANPPQKRAKIVFNKSMQRFTAAAADDLRKLAALKTWGLYTPPALKEETLYSNLLPVTKLPTHVFIAPSECKDRRDVITFYKQNNTKGQSEFILKQGNIISPNDLKADCYRDICDQSAIERITFHEWADSNETWAVELMNEMLRELVYSWYLVYHRGEELYYTLATEDGKPREWPVRGEKKASSITVYKRYQSKLVPDRVSYHRHSGFFSQFQCYDGSWYLMFSPAYYFTSDGRKKHSKHHEMLKKMKILERQKAVYGQLLMWSQRLQPSNDLFVPRYPFIEFGPLVSFTSSVGIDDHAWKPDAAELEEEFDADEGPDLGL